MPWRRLLVEWLFIAVVVASVSLVVSHNRDLGSYITILLGGVVYVGFGAGLAKLGYNRKTLRQLRAETAARPPTRSTASAAAPGRPKPAPTKRTSTGPTQRPAKKHR